MNAQLIIQQITEAKKELGLKYNLKPEALKMNRNTFRELGKNYGVKFEQEVNANFVNKFSGNDVYFDDEMEDGDVDTLVKYPFYLLR